MGRIALRRRLALELWRKREQRLVKEHPLRQLFWECTLRCNLHCLHCGSDCKQEATQRDMPVADFLKVLDRIAAETDPHKVFVVVTGGEPLMRPDLEACGRAIYERGFPWGMVTNGLAMTEARFRRLLAAGLHTATVSLDGLEEEHSWMRGHGRSYERALAAIRMMAAMPNFVFDVVTCVNRRNINGLHELRDLLIANGVRRWRIFTVFPVGRAAEEEELQLSPAQFRSLLDFIRTTRREGQIQVDYACEGFLGDYEGEVRSRFYTCRAGITVASVLCDGSISACASIRANYRQGNIYRDDFWQVWQERFAPYRNREWMRTGACADCDLFRYCQGNGMHLRDEEGKLLRCQMELIER